MVSSPNFRRLHFAAIPAGGNAWSRKIVRRIAGRPECAKYGTNGISFQQNLRESSAGVRLEFDWLAG